MQTQTLENFIERLDSSLKNNTFIKISINHSADKNSDLKMIFAKRVIIKKWEKLSFTYRHKTKDIVKNYDFPEALQIIREILWTSFLQSELFTVDENVLAMFSSWWWVKLKNTKPKTTEVISAYHDKQKKRYISIENNIYLKELGVIGANFEVLPSMQDKFKQINKFLEIIDWLLRQVNLIENFSVADMGSWKWYLTFAVYDYITNILKRNANIIWIEYREELVNLCNQIAEKSDFKNLSFRSWTIENTESGNIDVLIALHACDTATDDAIYKWIISNSSIIVCSPCCHKQIRKQIKVTHEFSEILRNWILEERQAEIVTDWLRSLLMELNGYKTKVFEFISTEHTWKNLMITWVKSNEKVDKEKILRQIDAIKKFFWIEYHYLEKLLNWAK